VVTEAPHLGERRLRAARLAGWTEVPVTIVEADERQTAELAIVENLQRKDLDFIEEAEGLLRLVNVHGYRQEEVARALAAFAGRVPGDEVQYNEAAARVMKAAGIITEDLYQHSLAGPGNIQLRANVHYTPQGYQYLAQHVAAAIEAQLPKQPDATR